MFYIYYFSVVEDLCKDMSCSGGCQFNYDSNLFECNCADGETLAKDGLTCEPTTTSNSNSHSKSHHPRPPSHEPRPRHASDEGIEDEPDHHVNGVNGLKSCLKTNGVEERNAGGLSRSGSAKGGRDIKHVKLEENGEAMCGSLPSDLKLRNGHHGR